MPKAKLPNYQCPRCGYNTPYKCHMNDHLFKKNKPCCALENDLVLTDDSIYFL